MRGSGATMVLVSPWSVVVAAVVVAALVAVGPLAGCQSPEDRLAATVALHQDCAADDDCVLSSGSDCGCGTAVNRDGLEEVEAAEDAIQCCDLLGRCLAVECASPERVFCNRAPDAESGFCVAE